MDNKKPTRETKAKRQAKRRVFRGWISPNIELPKKTEERTEILFGNTKWLETDKRCKITVEWIP